MIYAQLVVSGLLLGGVYALISIGLTLIFGVLRVVNFAHGEFLMVGMFAAYWLFQLWAVPAFISALVMLPPFILFGFLVYRLVIRRTLGHLGQWRSGQLGPLVGTTRCVSDPPRVPLLPTRVKSAGVRRDHRVLHLTRALGRSI